MSFYEIDHALPDVKQWWDNESEEEFSDDPEDGYPYDEQFPKVAC